MKRKNLYRCPKGHETITVDRDEGVTPFMLLCRHSGCTEMAQSSFYQVDQKLVATVEFYKPGAEDPCMQDEAVRDHVRAGGLMPRSIGDTDATLLCPRQ